MSFDYGTLIIDRAASDSDALRALVKKPMSQWTAAEAEAFTAATLKGSYDYTDLNRVSACMEDLVARLNGLGYAVPGYERVKIDRTVTPTSRLPAGYTEVEYIQSSGTQYVDTGFKPDQDTKVELRVSLTQTGSHTLFGTDIGWGANGFALGCSFGHYGSNAQDFTGLNDGSLHDVVFDKNVISVDGTVKATLAAATFSMSTNMALFANNRSGSIEEHSEIRLDYLRIYSGEGLVRDYVPCTNSNNEVGLYDLVTQTFFGNAGTGSFAAGPTVEGETDTPSDSDALDPYLWYPEDAPTRPRIEQYRGNVAAVRAVLAMPDTTPEVPESLRKPTTDEVNTIEAILVAIDLILTHIPAARRHCGVTVCGLRGVIA